MLIEVLLLILGVLIVPSEQQKCDYNDSPPLCEWKIQHINWKCPPGYKIRANAFWGRVPGDSTTCTVGVPASYLSNLNCPGDDARASANLEALCNAKVQNGICKVRAANRKLKFDPCPGTFKYLKMCTYCQSETPAEPKTLLVLDSTGSMAARDKNYMPLLVDFLDSFFEFTSTDAFWSGHKTNLEIIPFTSRLDVSDKVTLDYSTFSTATELRAAEIEDIKKFKETMSNRVPTSLTNLGQVFKDLQDNYSSKDVKVVFFVSDFINIKDIPDYVTAATELTNLGFHVIPILLNKPTRHEKTYQEVVTATKDQHGYKIGATDKVPASEFQSIYGKLNA